MTGIDEYLRERAKEREAENQLMLKLISEYYKIPRNNLYLLSWHQWYKAMQDLGYELNNKQKRVGGLL